MYRKFGKRAIDFILAMLALIVLALPFALIALMIKTQMGSPVFFKQLRTGKCGKDFKILKFRTMSNERDENGVYLPDEERTNKLGKFLRATSIDELPSIINVLKNEMSIIGPRPLPTRYINRYTAKQLRRHEVLPGLSNISAISGRNILSWEEKFEMDVWYVDNLSFWLDIKIIAQTIKIVLTRKGVTSSEGSARGEFVGTASIDAVREAARDDYIKL